MACIVGLLLVSLPVGRDFFCIARQHDVDTWGGKYLRLTCSFGQCRIPKVWVCCFGTDLVGPWVSWLDRWSLARFWGKGKCFGG